MFIRMKITRCLRFQMILLMLFFLLMLECIHLPIVTQHLWGTSSWTIQTPFNQMTTLFFHRENDTLVENCSLHLQDQKIFLMNPSLKLDTLEAGQELGPGCLGLKNPQKKEATFTMLHFSS